MSSARSTSPPLFFFFFNDTATTEIYTLSLHDALPILLKRVVHGQGWRRSLVLVVGDRSFSAMVASELARPLGSRSEEHTSELQSRQYLVCRLLLEKKKNVDALAAAAERRAHDLDLLHA